MAARSSTSPNTNRLVTSLVQVGLRVTEGRLAVFRALVNAGRPMSQSELASALSNLAMDHSTVYRNLDALSAAGLARRLQLGDHLQRYESTIAAEHVEIPEHPHFVCLICGRITCLTEADTAWHEWVESLSAMGRISSLTIKGECHVCLEHSPEHHHPGCLPSDETRDHPPIQDEIRSSQNFHEIPTR